MISIAIGLVVLGAMLAIYAATSSSSRHTTTESRMNEDATIAMEVIGTQLRMAGFSLPRLAVSPGAAMVGGAKMAIPDRNLTGAGIRGCDHGFADFAAKDFDSLTCAKSASDPAAFAVRFEATDPADVSADLLPASTDCLGQDVKVNLVGALGNAYRMVESRYAIKATTSGELELSCGGNGSKFVSQPLVQFVEDIQIRYGIAADAASSDVQNYGDAAAIDALAGTVDQRWSRVVAVRMCLLMHGAQPEILPGTTYIDCDGNSATPAKSDGLFRRAYATVFTLRNRGGFAATP